jgi:hypothetical protein
MKKKSKAKSKVVVFDPDKNARHRMKKGELLEQYFDKKGPFKYVRVEVGIAVQADSDLYPHKDDYLRSEGYTSEFTRDMFGVRVLITDIIQARDAVRVLRKIIARIEGDPSTLIEWYPHADKEINKQIDERLTEEYDAMFGPPVPF